MSKDSATAGRLGEDLVRCGYISRLQLVEAFVLAKASGLTLEQVLLDRRYVTPGQLEQARFGQWRLVQLA